jgi:hypothetical protein
MGGGNVIIDRTADFCELNSGQLRGGSNIDFAVLLSGLLLGPDKFVRLRSNLVRFNGLLNSDSISPDTLFHLIGELQQTALAIVLLRVSTINY